MSDDAQIVRALEALQATCQAMQSEMAGMRAQAERMSAQQQSMQTEIATLNKLVRDGNGQPSLLFELSAHRESIKKLSGEMREIDQGMSHSKTQAIFWLLGLIATAAIAVSSWFARRL